MEKVEKAIETTATINVNRQLILDEPLPVIGPAKVRVIILLPEDTEINEKEWLKAAGVNPAFYFLREPEENIYSITDGKPFHD